MGLLDFLSNLGGGTQGAGDPNGGILAGIGGFARNNTNALTGLGTGLLSGPNWTTGIAAAGPAFQQGHQEDLRNQIFQNSMRANAAVINNMNLDPALKQAALANPQIAQQIVAQKFAQPKYSFSAPTPDGTIFSQNDLTGQLQAAGKSAVPNDIVPIPGTNQIASVNRFGTSPSALVTPAGLPPNFSPLTPQDRAQFGIDPKTPGYKDAMGQPHILGPSTNVSMALNQEGAQKAAEGGAIGNMFVGAMKDGFQAQNDLGKLDVLGANLAKLPGGLIGGLQGVANGMGLKIGSNASNAEAASSIISSLVPQARDGLPGAASDRDVNMFRDAMVKLSNTPQGNAIILGTMKAAIQNRIARAQIASQEVTGQMSSADAINALQKLPDPYAQVRQLMQNGNQQTSTNPSAPSLPSPGHIDSGYRFKGGDPSDQNNWEKVQ